MKKLFLIVSLMSSSALAQHKIIYLISTIRSLSHAFLRIMESRGDFTVINEPSNSIYDAVHYPQYTKDWYLPHAFKTFDEIKQTIFERAKNSNVFVVDMSFSAYMTMAKDEEFIKNPDVYFAFLVRNPHASAISLYKKVNEIVDGLYESLGHHASWELFKSMKDKTFNKQLIIPTEDLYNSPEHVLMRLSEAWNIPYLKDSLTWKPLGADFDGYQEWNEQKKKEITQHWCKELLESKGLTKPSSYEVDQDGLPTFSEISNDEHRKAFYNAYKENLVYYNLLMDQKEYILKK